MGARAATSVILMFLSSGLRAQEASPAPPGSKEVAIRQLLETTGGARMGLQVLDNLIATFKRTSPAVPEDFWTELRSEFRASDLVDLCVPIYDRHLSEEEVRGILAFYETPSGKRLLEVQPLIVQESMQAGQEWGRALSQRVINKLKDKGYVRQSNLAAGPADEQPKAPVTRHPARSKR